MNKERTTISVDPEIKAEFEKVAKPKGIKLSPWIQSKMEEFIEESKHK